MQKMLFKTKLQSLLGAFFPYAILGIAVVLTITIFTLFAYLFVWGLVIGAVIFAGLAIKNYFFPKKTARTINVRVIKR